MNHEPQPEPRTPNPELRTPNPEPRTPNSELRTPNSELLTVRDLRLEFQAEDGARTRVLDGISFTLARAEALGLVGESGSGKSVLARALTRLLPSPPACYLGGEVWLHGRELWSLPPARLREVRGRGLAQVFQDPAAHLDPLMSVGAQVAEVLHFRRGLDWRTARTRAVGALARVGLPDPELLVRARPASLSGGMQQRVLLALALACEPAVLVADEATSALDVTLQAQLLELLERLRRETGLALLLISHDLGLVAERTARVAVLYRGRLVEQGPTAEVLRRPFHPYTAALLAAVPRLEAPCPGGAPTTAPSPTHMTSARAPWAAGCAYVDRCPAGSPRCRETPPEEQVRSSPAERRVACHHPLHGSGGAP